MAQTIKLKRSSVAGRVPTTSDLDLGEVAINTADGKMYIKKDTGGTESIIEIGSSGVTSSFTLYEYTATASQTDFSGVDSNSNTLAYDTGNPPKVQVFLNGVLLDFTTDYTATNGTTVSLTVGADAGDLLQVAAYKSVTVDSDIALGDNTKLLLGNDSDFWAYHDGSNTIFNQTGTGNLLIQKDETTVAEVTASGITLTGELDTDTVQFDTTGTGVTSAGQISWNTDTDTLELGLNANVNLELGEQNYFQVKAGEALSKGDVVYASGAVGNSGKIEVSKYIANGTIEERFVLGLAAENIANGQFGFVMSLGTLRGVSANGSALTVPETWTDGTVLYASPTVAGELTSTEPVAPNQAIALAFVVSDNASNGVFAVRAYDLGLHLGEVHDVYIASESDNDILQWSTANSRWENVAGTTTNIAEGTNLYYTSARFDTAFSAKSTTDLSEGTNLYYTDARFDTRLGTKSTTDLAEGTNLYYTSTRFDTAFSAKTTDNLSEGSTNLYYTSARANTDFDTRLATKTTDNLSEGTTNLYYTDTRARAAVSATTGSAAYNSTTGVFTLPGTTDHITEGTNLFYTDARVDSRLSSGSVSNIQITGYLRGPATFTIDPAAHGDDTGTVVIAGNLQVDGTTTTINSTTLTVDDKNIVLADGAANAAAADGAGITIDGASASLTYSSSSDRFEFNKPAYAGSLYADNVQTTGSIGNLTAGSLGQQMEIGDASVTTLRFDADRWRLYAGNNAGEIISAYENGNIDFTTGSLLKGGTAWMDSSRNLTNIGAVTTSGVIAHTGSEGREVQTYMPSSYTTGDLVAGHEYGWYSDHWRVGMTRSAAADGDDFVIQWNGTRKFDLSKDGDATFAGTISSGAITSNGNLTVKGTQGFNASGETASIYLGDTASEIRATYNGGTSFYLNAVHRMEIEGSTGNLNLITGNFEINGTTVIDSSRNLTNIGTLNGGTPWHSANDGSGSGLDADLLDGLQGSSYLRSDAADSFGAQLSSANNIAIRFVAPNATDENDGKIGAGTFGSGLNIVGAQTSAGTGRQVRIWGSVITDGGNAFWHSGNDGSGSGLDADLLDGVQAASFLRSDADDTFTGNLTTGANNHITFGPNGTWGSYLRVGGNGRTATGTEMASVVTIDGNLHLDAADSTNAIYLNYYAGTNGTAFGTGAGGISAWMSPSGQLYKSTGVNDTSNPYWHAANDGSGSGLDADLLDGIDSSQFLRSDTSDTMSGELSVSGNIAINGSFGTSYPLAVSSGQRYLIGMRNTSADANYPWFFHETSSSQSALGIHFNAVGDRFLFREDGNAYFNGGIVYHSGNDGSGSGLDADLLDGQQPSALSVNYANTAGSAPANGGTATALNGSNYITRSGSSGNYNTDFNNTPAGSVRHQGDDYNITNSPGGVWWFVDNYRHSNSSNSWGTQVAWGWEDNANKLAQRNVSGGNWSSWVYYWNTGNDGSGSGLDADLLDGLNSTSFWRSDTNQYSTVNTEHYFWCDRNGYCGSTTSAALQAYSSGNNSAFLSFHKGGHYAVNMGLDADNVLRIGGWSASANRWVLDMSGNMTAAGNVTAYSDIRLKENIKVIPDALEKVQKIRGVTFTRNDQEDKEKLHAGVIAQEVEAVLPEVISEDNLGIKNVAYGNMVGLLIEAIKELKAEVDDLKTQLEKK